MTDDLSERPAAPASAPSAPPPPAKAGSFEFNHPTVIALLYLGSFVTGITALVGVVLAYVWKDEPGQEDWMQSHYAYLIRTFWIGLIGSVAGVILTVVLIGVFVLLATAALVIVRSIMSLLAAQKRAPMPNPASWTI